MSTNWLRHLRDRGLSNKIEAILDHENEVCTFPIWSPGKNFVGYQAYRWKAPKTRSNKGRYFTWITEHYRQATFWGYEYSLGNAPLFIVESIWNAARLINHDERVIATLGATPHEQAIQKIKMLWPNRRRIVILDNDANKAGDAMKKLGEWYYPPQEYADLNEMSHEAVGEFLEKIR